MPVSHVTALKIENGFRQNDLTLELIRYYLEPERPFALRVPLILDLKREAVAGIEAKPGKIRHPAVGIHESAHSLRRPIQQNIISLDFVNSSTITGMKRQRSICLPMPCGG